MQGKKAEKLLHRKEALQIKSDHPEESHSWWLIVMYLPFCWLCAKQKGNNPGKEPGGRIMLKRKGLRGGRSDAWWALPKHWMDKVLLLALLWNNPLWETGVKAPEQSKEFVLLIGNENLECFLVGDVASFPILLVCWFGVVFSSWAESQEIQTGEGL